MLDDVPHNRHVHIVVLVDEHIAKADHVAQRCREARVKPARALDQVEQFAIRSRFSEPAVGDDVRRNVDGRLNGDLERVFDESLFSQVARKLRGFCQTSKVGDARSMRASFLAMRSGSVNARP